MTKVFSSPTRRAHRSAGSTFAEKSYIRSANDSVFRGAFHAFRHDHATTMFSEGCPNPNDVKDNMGHADIRTTMRYTHAISNDRREAVNRATLAHLRHSAALLEGKLLQTN
jgi:integrase